MTNPSADLTWLLVRDSSSFLLKKRTQDGTVFTREPYNLRNVNSYKNSGLANPKAIGITKADRGVDVTLRAAGKLNKPGQQKRVLKFQGPTRHASTALAAALTKGGYRADLTKDALARVSALKRKPTRKPAQKRSRHGNKK